MPAPFEAHLRSSEDLITTYEATRAGFVALALEKNRRADPYVAEARALQEAARAATTPHDLLSLPGIERGLLTAAGLSDKALNHLLPEDRAEAVANLIKNFLEPAGAKFVEELVFRFLLTRGDTLGGSMRNIGGALAQRKLTRALISTLVLAGTPYWWQHSKTGRWVKQSDEDWEIEYALRGLSWEASDEVRTLIYNLSVPLIQSNVDMCLFSLDPRALKSSGYGLPQTYIALGELKGGIDPAGADEHWKTARTALLRIREAFSRENYSPLTFFIGAAIERRMAGEIWQQLQDRTLSNTANLNEDRQVASISRWLCTL